MVKKTIIATLVVVATLFVLGLATGVGTLFMSSLFVDSENAPGQKTIKVEDLPWQIELQADGASRVFNITLGQTSLDELSRRLNKIPEIAVFIKNEGPEAIEGYFGNIRLGLFDAKFVLMLDASTEMLQRVANNAGEPEPMPSGSWKRVVGEQDIADVVNLPIKEITYVPSVAYEPELVEQRFGQPSEILVLDEISAYWLYPDKGLAILMNQEEKELLQYVHPQTFPDLKQRIEQEIINRQKSAEQK
jgi:hypothetical protein